MIQPHMNKNHHVYFDNFLLSLVLLIHLELQQTYACSTFRCNRKGLPACASNKLTRPGQLVQAQKGNIAFTKWHDKRDVAFLVLMFLQEKLRALYSEKKKGRKLRSWSHAFRMFTQRTWAVLTEQITFAHSIMLDSSRESGTNICFGFLWIWLPVMLIF